MRYCNCCCCCYQISLVVDCQTGSCASCGCNRRYCFLNCDLLWFQREALHQPDSECAQKGPYVKVSLVNALMLQLW